MAFVNKFELEQSPTAQEQLPSKVHTMLHADVYSDPPIRATTVDEPAPLTQEDRYYLGVGKAQARAFGEDPDKWSSQKQRSVIENARKVLKILPEQGT